MYKNCIKRLLDILLSLTGIILLCWLYLILFILVRVKLGSPVLFRQQRPGKNEKIFTLYKFRTMTDASRLHTAYRIWKTPAGNKSG